MSTLIEKIVGHKEQVQSLLQSLKLGQLPSALIFHGPGGVGKKTLVRALLQVANCQQSPLACGRCSPCVRSLQHKNEMIHEITLQSKKNISVDQIRDLHSQLSLQSVHPARFVIIDPADRLSKAAANALLKLLEEAPKKTHFFLLTHRMASLLTTIRSRCHRLSFTELTREELGKIQEFSDTALIWSRGRVEQALALEEEGAVEQLDQSLKFFSSLLWDSPQDWKKKAPWFFTKDGGMESCLGFWGQALEKRLWGEQKDQLDWLPADSKSIVFVFERLLGLERDLWANVDRQLAIENFYYSLKQVLPRTR